MLPDSKSCKVHSILEGVDVERFNPGPREEPTTEPFRILCVARLIEEKGILHLLRACAILRERGHDFHCEIIGGPEQPFYTNYYVEIKKLFRKLQLKSHVSLSGVKPFADVLERYQESNLFVLPCVTAENGGRDISPHALLEAMAMKLPVISTHQAAIPEIVEHGVNGILVPPGDETALADAMIELMKKPGVRMELADNARKTVEERFNIGANIENFHKLFLGQHLVAESLPSARTP
jgi:glycosyltransferase involved in cell wall biosynthesis